MKPGHAGDYVIYGLAYSQVALKLAFYFPRSMDSEIETAPDSSKTLFISNRNQDIFYHSSQIFKFPSKYITSVSKYIKKPWHLFNS